MLLVELNLVAYLNITISKKILNYILYIKSFDLNCSGKSSLQSHLMEMSEYFNLPDFITDLLDIAI